MIERDPKCCVSCDDGGGESVFPYYGLAPHKHSLNDTEFVKGQYPANFTPDGDGTGIWTHCIECEANQLPDSVIQSIKEMV